MVAMPANGRRGGAEIRNHRKRREGGKKGWADSNFSTVATRVGWNLNPILATHTVNSRCHTPED